jgi:hypothetical protein
MTLSPNGTVFVGTRNQGVVYALLPGESWRRAAKVVHVAKGLNSPNGVAFRNGALSWSFRPWQKGRIVSAWHYNPPQPALTAIPRIQFRSWCILRRAILSIDLPRR